jgi:ATP-binding protein involved in chromosome partitioning
MSVPLREGSDAGAPSVLVNPQDSASLELQKIAKAIADEPLGLSGRRLKLSV